MSETDISEAAVAKQLLSSEMKPEEAFDADFEGGYDGMVLLARSLRSTLTRAQAAISVLKAERDREYIRRDIHEAALTASEAALVEAQRITQEFSEALRISTEEGMRVKAALAEAQGQVQVAALREAMQRASDLLDGIAPAAADTVLQDALASTSDFAARRDRDMQVKGMREAAEIAGLHAWKHVGEDAYSCGMDAGAIHQCKVIVDAIRAAAKRKGESYE